MLEHLLYGSTRVLKLGSMEPRGSRTDCMSSQPRKTEFSRLAPSQFVKTLEFWNFPRHLRGH